MYAIVRAGGRQEKVAVGDVLTVDRLKVEDGGTVTLPALLVVDGATVTSDADALAKVSVTAEVVEQTKGPKINGFVYKNASNNRRRWGHRQTLARIEITGISKG